MKIDRLLSIFFYLLNRNLVSARELANHFEVSVRTIQRDIDALCFAGIPVVSVQGSKGGYGIIDGYKLDRQCVDTNDLFYILTALESIGASFQNKQIGSTLEKIKTLVRDHQIKEIERRKEKLSIDFSGLNIGERSSELFRLLDEGIEKSQLIAFSYTDKNYKMTNRIVEPMTIVFAWFSWYLYGFCRMRNDYRLFRLSRMRGIKLQEERFERREQSYEDFCKRYAYSNNQQFARLVLKFDPSIKVHVEDYFKYGKIEIRKDGSVVVEIGFPEDEWLYSLILSYGDKVEVLEPPHIREIIFKRGQGIIEKYQNKKASD